jgi:serine/threonine protein kinase
MTPAPDLHRTAITPGDWLPGYEMLSAVGAGGFGTVYKARQFKLNRVVAVKVVYLDPATQPALAARFENEAVTLGRLHHPNVVQVYDYGFHAGRMFIVMELLDGEDLGDRLKHGGPLAERVAWEIARQAASALAHAASHGVIHRDVKPPNLVLVPAPTGFGLPPGVPLVKVTDFGLARTKWAANGDDGRLTAPGAVLGTPLYMAPEQYRGQADLDHRVDIYALGATVFHALAGRPPFAGDNVWDVMVQKMERSPTWDARGSGHTAVSRESIALVEAMMAPDPANRVGNYEDLLARIDALPVMRDEAAPRPTPTPGRPWWRYAAVAVGSLAVAVLGISVGLPSAPTSAAVDRPGVRYVSAGHQISLFDTTTLSGWLPTSAGGQWRLDKDDDLAKVMIGTGWIRRPYTAAGPHRVIVGLDVFEADAAEVHFAVQAGVPDAAARRLVVRVTKADGATFGSKVGSKGQFISLGPAAKFPKASTDGRPYVEVKIERLSDVWSVTFNGAEVGRASVDGPPRTTEIRLNAEGGPARVDSVVLEPLERVG